MAPIATRPDIPKACQNEKNNMPFTHRNLGTGLVVVSVAIVSVMDEVNLTEMALCRHLHRPRTLPNNTSYQEAGK
jgi:hypothetical protein